MSELLPIIDAHVHLWNPAQFTMPWLADLPELNRPFGLSDYRAQTQGLPISELVYVEVAVEPQEALLEAREIVSLAQQEPRLQAIVAAAQLEHGSAVYSQLAELAALSPLIKGVRRNLQDETDDAFCLRPAFVAGVRLLAEFGLSFEICIKHWQLPAVTELVRLCPDTAFVLDHLGKPDIKQQQLAPWQSNLQALAALPNVVCKLSGLVTEADHASWRPADLAPFVTSALAAFGTERVLFGGDWPVALLASSYTRWYETLSTLTASLPLSSRRKLWADNARRVYRLE
ncbi:MAG TPA: amidohydrolase family protein [Ktedonobacteraceae bacterium]